MSSKFLQLALLTNDSSALLLAVEELNQRKFQRGPKFDLNSYGTTRCKVDFRFLKNDIFRLAEVFGIPEKMRTSERITFSGIEGLCLLLRRLAYPSRLVDLEVIFGRSRQELSRILNTMLDYLYNNFKQLVTTLNQWWLQPPMLRNYSDAVRQKGALLDNCFGFIDGTKHAICRPTYNQKEVYSGHKRVHCLKYQGVVIPSGLLANLFGPIAGRRHDSYMLAESELVNQIENHLGGENFYLYADAGYPMRRRIITPFQGNNITVQQRTFNTTMSQMRIVVEWAFGGLFSNFAFLDFKKNQKLYLQPVAKYVVVATIFRNCQVCLYGNQISDYFGVPPPSLESYVKNNPFI